MFRPLLCRIWSAGEKKRALEILFTYWPEGQYKSFAGCGVNPLLAQGNASSNILRRSTIYRVVFK